ncbi:nitroreductase family deazaflavin-dependent oxidoreductase [Gordonia sp. LSe1-13]|uniref:Nitroreductase family deazaflavin-dependent oxidoreductase n=1 Tax=Gordonia sesuvii TaxID=3116777 RepID=A0ABU7MJ37_9ACTN|nr:nitroreductase family deazaflavin-dependent oxidoreductase [Gordonia sp. LSe1-13]
MSEADDWNTQIINEFRENDGKVGGPFEGAPMVLLHHVGRKSGKQNVTPLMYMPDDEDSSLMYIFASKAGAPTHPAWYHNLTAAGSATVEVGTDSFDVAVTEVTGDDRDEIYGEQAKRYPGFAEYESKTEGIRTIPVLALRRS